MAPKEKRRNDAAADLIEAVQSMQRDLMLMDKLVEQMKIACLSYANKSTAVALTLNRLMGEINKTEE